MGAGGNINGRLNIFGSLYVNDKPIVNTALNFGVTYVQMLSDFPAPVNSVIQLSANQSYIVTSTVDLAGNRLVSQGNISLVGISPDVSKLTSTGLSPTTPLISSVNNVYLKDLSFLNNPTILDLNSSSLSNNVYLNNCIFRNCSSMGTIKNYELTLFDTVLCYNVGGIKFDGTMSSVILFQSILSAYPNTTGITLLSSASFGRRFRVTNTAIVNPDTTSTGIQVITGASIPTEGFVLESVTFSPSSNAVVGISSNDNRASIINCSNIRNSSSVAQLFMSANAIATAIPNTTTFFKMSGNSISGPILEKFSIANNRITYTGASERNFIISVASTVASTNGNDIIVAIAKNGTVDNFSWAGVTTTGTPGVAVNSHVFETLRQNDFLEFFVRNATATNNITISYLNIVIRSVN